MDMTINTKGIFMRNLFLMLPGLVMLAACTESSSHGHAHEEDAHGHGSELSVDTTIWTNDVELFVEYPAFVVGNTSRFAAHFTILDGHQPVKEGEVTVSLIKGKTGIRHTVQKPSSPGIFTPALQPKEAGEYQLLIDLDMPLFKQRFDLGKVQVYPDDETATEVLSKRDQSEPEISFLKEQAWKIGFQTAPVQEDTVYGMIKLAGRWMPEPGTQRTLNAGSSGNVLYEVPSMVQGIAVKKGQVLMRISGKDLNVNGIESEIRKAKAEFEQVKSEYDRKKELHQLQVVPDAEFEEVEKRYAVAQANYQQLLNNYGANGVAIRAPFDGYVKDISVENGAFAGAGQPLITVGSELSSMIQARVSPEKRGLVTQTKKVWVLDSGKTLPVKGKVVSVGQNVTEGNPMLSVFIEVKSPVTAVEGNLAEVQLGYSNNQMGLVIPKDALLEDFGTYKVVVQNGGEAFAMRPVEIGAFNGDRVTITRGLQNGEWVVTTGAYQVKMASMAGSAPAHGHAH
tara:strand:- start:20024 stop:21553 length:1530 start_codon:yes stop_codon:yes gene_type:complete